MGGLVVLLYLFFLRLLSHPHQLLGPESPFIFSPGSLHLDGPCRSLLSSNHYVFLLARRFHPLAPDRSPIVQNHPKHKDCGVVDVLLLNSHVTNFERPIHSTGPGRPSKVQFHSPHHRILEICVWLIFLLNVHFLRPWGQRPPQTYQGACWFQTDILVLTVFVLWLFLFCWCNVASLVSRAFPQIA